MAEEPSGSLETETSTHTGGNRHVPMRGMAAQDWSQGYGGMRIVSA